MNATTETLVRCLKVWRNDANQAASNGQKDVAHACRMGARKLCNELRRRRAA